MTSPGMLFTNARLLLEGSDALAPAADVLVDGNDARRSQLRELELRMSLDQPANVIRSATAVNAERLMMKRELGTIAVDAYADLLVVDGDPLTDPAVLAHPEQHLHLIMKDGVLYKNELSTRPPAVGS